MGRRSPLFKSCVIECRSDDLVSRRRARSRVRPRTSSARAAVKRLRTAFRVATPRAAGRGPRPALEPETVEGRGGGERFDAIEAYPRPLEAALLQHPARGSVGHPRAGVDHLVPEMLEGVIDQRARG